MDGVNISLSDELLRVAEAYAAASNRTLAGVSGDVLGRGGKLREVAQGRDISVRRAESAIQWFSDHWPEDVEWPKDARRPPPREATP